MRNYKNLYLTTMTKKGEVYDNRNRFDSSKQKVYLKKALTKDNGGTITKSRSKA